LTQNIIQLKTNYFILERFTNCLLMFKCSHHYYYFVFYDKIYESFIVII